MKLKNMEEMEIMEIQESLLGELDLFIITNTNQDKIHVTLQQDQDYHEHNNYNYEYNNQKHGEPEPEPVQIFRRTKSGKFVLITPRDTCSIMLLPVSVSVKPVPATNTSISTNTSNSNKDELMRKIEILERQVQMLTAARNTGINMALPQLHTGPSELQNLPEGPEGAGDYSINGKIESEENDSLYFPSVSGSDLRVLEKWSYRNVDLLESDYGIERGDEFLSDVRFIFNPTVKIERWMFLDPRDDCDYRNRIRQEEFAKELGLIHVNDKMLTAQSRRSFRQRKSIREVKALILDKTPSQQQDLGDKNKERPKVDKPKPDNSDHGIQKPANRMYSEAEDLIIIKWVLEEDRHKKVHGNVVWKEIEQTDILPIKRSWQSLRQRYRKIILSNLRAYGLTHAQETKLKIGAQKGILNRSKKALSIFNTKYKLSKSFLNDEKKKSSKEKQGKSNSPKTIIKYKLNTPLTKLSDSKSKNKVKNFRKLFTQKSFQS